MEKYYLKNGKEVKIGDKVISKKTEQTEHGNMFVKECILVTESSIPYLIKRGIISKKNNVISDEVVATKILTKISNFLEFSEEDTLNFLYIIYTLNESALRSILYKKIAVEFDKAYPDYIAEAKEVWVINLMYNTIDVVSVNRSMDFTKFAAFRTENDAKKAVKLVDTIIESLNAENN